MAREHERSSAMLQAMADECGAEGLSFDEILDRSGRRAFGVILILVCLPAFLPLPAGAGAVSGPLAALLGLQLMIGQRRPWLPKQLRARRVSQARITGLSRRVGPWLSRLEHVSRPRLEGIVRSIPGGFIVGVLITLLGVALSLPIPLTNYPLALLIVAFAVALIERDGALMLVLWAISLFALGVTIEVSGELIELARAKLTG